MVETCIKVVWWKPRIQTLTTPKGDPTMVYKYQGHYQYDDGVVRNWDSSAIGVYYCGYPLSNGNLLVHYVGRAVGKDGIRGRLLQHMLEDLWSDISHFGYSVCSTIQEAENLEASEIKRLKPKYNKQGK